MNTDHKSLWAVRKTTRNKIDALEGEQELVERESPLWEYIEQQIEFLRKKLHTLEFMIYNGVNDE